MTHFGCSQIALAISVHPVLADCHDEFEVYFGSWGDWISYEENAVATGEEG